MKRFFFSVLILISFYSFSFSQSVGIKTNLVHWATTTPNIGVEFAFNSVSYPFLGQSLIRLLN